jgi:hypothetical protein
MSSHQGLSRYCLTLAFGAADLGLQANLTILSQLEDIDEEDEPSEQVKEDVPHAMGTIRHERCSIFQPIKHALYNLCQVRYPPLCRHIVSAILTRR